MASQVGQSPCAQKGGLMEQVGSSQPTRHVAIIGGGTAGWLAALMCQKQALEERIPLKLTLIESSKIPTIGVGEGTTSVFGDVLRQLGINEAEFLSQTDATIKYGIRHRDWRALGHSYDGPIDDPYALSEPIAKVGNWIDTFCVAAGRPVTEPHIFAALMAKDKAPVARQGARDIALSPYQHAYHFDQAKVGRYLRSKAKGITLLDAVVSHAEKDPQTGDIQSVALDNGPPLEAELFIDCTGFRRALIAEVMGSTWVDYGDVLPVNRAMPFWLDHPKDGDIPTYTLAWAQKSGWMWQIPTQERMGCGYVYSDHHCTPEEAQREIEAVLGHPIEPRNDIKINAGRLSEVWKGNVLALGLAASFLEPLEATSIHGTVVALMLFLKRHFASIGEHSPEDRARFNDAIASQVDDFRDFINLHYVSTRDDSPFWRDVAAQYIQPHVRERLAHWMQNMPASRDFKNELDGLPHIEELLHYPVLDGLGLLSQDTARAQMAQNKHLRDFARQSVDHLRKEAQRAASQALSHRAWLASLR